MNEPSSSEKDKDRSKDLYEAHPFALRLAVLQEGAKSSPALTLTISYLPALNVVTASVPAAEELALIGLYPGDNGTHSPNPANAFLAEGEFKFDVTKKGRPFKWLQRFCGLNFLADSTEGASDPMDLDVTAGVPTPDLTGFFRAIRERITAVRALNVQLEHLGPAPPFFH